MSNEIIPYSDPSGVSTMVRDGRLDDAQKALIRQRICKDAKDVELQEFFWTCEKYGLNPFGRAQIWGYPRDGRLVIQVGINGDRLIAARTGQYEGQSEPEWCGTDGVWRQFWNADKPPEAARVGVWRKGARFPTYGIANYREFVQKDRNGQPAANWKSRPAHMLAKVAESHALRKCFQAEFAELSATFEPMLDERHGRANQPAQIADLYPVESSTIIEVEAPQKSATVVERAEPAMTGSPADWGKFWTVARGDPYRLNREQVHAVFGLGPGANELKNLADKRNWAPADALSEFLRRWNAAQDAADAGLPEEHDDKCSDCGYPPDMCACGAQSTEDAAREFLAMREAAEPVPPKSERVRQEAAAGQH